MIETLLCAWCLCAVSGKELIGCGTCGSGKPEDMARASYDANKVGVMFMSECKKEDEKFEIDWKSKNGIFNKRSKE